MAFIKSAKKVCETRIEYASTSQCNNPYKGPPRPSIESKAY